MPATVPPRAPVCGSGATVGEAQRWSSGLMQLAATISRYGRAGVDLESSDRGNDALRTAKHFAKYRPAYFSISATGIRLDLQGELLGQPLRRDGGHGPARVSPDPPALDRARYRVDRTARPARLGARSVSWAVVRKRNSSRWATQGDLGSRWACRVVTQNQRAAAYPPESTDRIGIWRRAGGSIPPRPPRPARSARQLPGR